MKLELEIIEFFKYLEELDIDISQKTSRWLIQEYYHHIGFTTESSLMNWFEGLATKKYKPYSEVEKAIKSARNYELRWRRNINQ